MKVSLGWLKDYVDLPESLTAEQIAYDLTMSTVEVEDVIDLAEQYTNMCVGKVLEIKKHPNADTLKLVLVDLGDEKKNIICGGINLKEGMCVAVAKPGAKVRWHGEGDLVELKETKIRGESSYGMICASNEIGLEGLFPLNDEKEIIDLSANPAEPGTSLADYLNFNDVIFDIDNKSLTNRPDLWGHYGIARELSAIYSTNLKSLPSVSLEDNGQDQVQVVIEDKEFCNRYLATIIDNVSVDPAPFWLQSRLVRVGQRPINLLVDLTNYVMFAVGQPMHTFDCRHIKDHTVQVRKATKGEKITLLDDKEVTLDTDTLVVADVEKPVILAGVMGAKNSGIEDDTTKVLFEVAHFNPQLVRKTVAKYGLRTESSMRYDKGVDSERGKLGVNLFIHLLREVQPNIEITAHLDQYAKKPAPIVVNLDHHFINSRIGQYFEAEKIVSTLELLGFKVQQNGEAFGVTVPSWRATGDISLPEDIVEEVARLYGFDNLEFVAPTVALTESISQPKYKLEKQVREFLAYNAGLNEVFTYPWMEDIYVQAAGLDLSSAHKLFDPPSPKSVNIKTSLLPNMLQAVANNLRYFESFGLFELGRVFDATESSEHSGEEENLPYQPKILAGVVVGKDARQAYLKVKGIIEGLINLSEADIVLDDNVQMKCAKGNTAICIKSEQELLGSFCLMADSVLRKADIKHASVAYFEINFSEFLELGKAKTTFQLLPKFPEVDYELSVVFDEETSWQEISKTVKKSSKLIKEVSFCDEYKGKQLAQGKKSIAFNMHLGDSEGTLTSEQIEQVANKVLKKLGNLGGELRS